MRRFLDSALAFVYPDVCQVCGDARATRSEGYVCAKCWQQVRFIRPPFCERCGLPFDGEITTEFECGNCREMDLHFVSARSAVVAKGMVLDVIHRFKYNRALWFETFLADLLVREAAPVLKRENWDCIVPVPLHVAKQREREFNQAEHLARHLSRATGIPMNSSLIKRVAATRTQTLLTRQERAANVRSAFAMRAGNRKLNGQRIVLVDDVFTTGATTSACARALRAAGAGDVCVWTVARGL